MVHDSTGRTGLRLGCPRAWGGSRDPAPEVSVTGKGNATGIDRRVCLGQQCAPERLGGQAVPAVGSIP